MASVPKEVANLSIEYCILLIITLIFIFADSSADHNDLFTHALSWIIKIVLGIGWIWITKILIISAYDHTDRT